MALARIPIWGDGLPPPSLGLISQGQELDQLTSDSEALGPPLMHGMCLSYILFFFCLCFFNLLASPCGMKVKGASLLTQMVKNLPTIQETWVRSLGREDPLEKGMATNSSILAWQIPWTEEPGVL